MEQFGWTERQLYEDNSLERMAKISEYNAIRKLAQDEEERRAKQEAQSARYRGR